MKRTNKILISAALVIVLALQLLVLYYIKYNNQNLALSEFNLSNIGNILNLFTILILILGIVIYTLQKKNKLPISRIILFTLLTTIILASAYCSTIISLPFQKIYFLGQHGNKLFVGLLFIHYLFALFTFASYMWLSVFGRKSVLFLRSIIHSVLIIFVLILFAFYYVNVSDPQIDNEKLSQNEKNIAVVFGAAVWSKNQPSPILAARVEKALQLLDSYLVGKVLLTGSNAPGELTEAEVAYIYALSKDADSSKFIIENITTSTNEQIHFIREELLPKESINEVIIVSDEFHLARIEEISKFNNIKIYAVSSDLKLKFETELYNRLRESIGLFFFWFFAI